MQFSNVIYRIDKGVKQRKALKSYTCEKCKNEIPKGDLYFEYKPLPGKRYWSPWRKRCIDCKPKYYDEVDWYENTDKVNFIKRKEAR